MSYILDIFPRTYIIHVYLLIYNSELFQINQRY